MVIPHLWASWSSLALKGSSRERADTSANQVPGTSVRSSTKYIRASCTSNCHSQGLPSFRKEAPASGGGRKKPLLHAPLLACLSYHTLWHRKKSWNQPSHPELLPLHVVIIKHYPFTGQLNLGKSIYHRNQSCKCLHILGEDWIKVHRANLHDFPKFCLLGFPKCFNTGFGTEIVNWHVIKWGSSTEALSTKHG